jgi:hypothetical protein
MVSRFGPQNWQLRFGDLCLKITTAVFGLGIKTKRVMVCQLRHKTDGRRTAQGTHQDLATCFTWK